MIACRTVVSCVAATAATVWLAAQAPASPIATLLGTSVQLSGGATELDALGRLRIFSGTTVALDGATARLDLVRGGTIAVCGPARLSLGAGADGALLLALEQGAVEMRYAATVPDAFITPDFRITTVVPPQQMATVSASVAMGATGAMCVGNRGSALEVERLFDGAKQFVVNGQAVWFSTTGEPSPAATCPCSAAAPSAVPGAVTSTNGAAGAMFPQAPALQYDAAGNPITPAIPATAPATAPPAAHGHNFLVRFARWLIGKKN